MLKRIGVANLRMGMHIHELCGSWMDHPFWRTRFILDDADDIRRLRASGITEVWIDTALGLDVLPAEPQAAARTEAEVAAEVDQALAQADRQGAPRGQVATIEELARAVRICTRGKSAVVSMFNEARMGKAISTTAADALVDEISSSVMRNPGALISLARLKTA
ncbi:MAG: DUF3391 domain-containing protein, partial [Sulfuritalea sp.]|nr:DUF3391 domain-containing protein [Sulfuritalea sp.]